MSLADLPGARDAADGGLWITGLSVRFAERETGPLWTTRLRCSARGRGRCCTAGQERREAKLFSASTTASRTVSALVHAEIPSCGSTVSKEVDEPDFCTVLRRTHLSYAPTARGACA